MAQLVTPFYSTIVFPLVELDETLLGPEWVSGLSPTTNPASRATFYSDRAAIDSMLRPNTRWHCEADIRTRQLEVEVAELVRHSTDWSAIVGHLVLHLRSAGTASASQGFTDLGKVARPNTALSMELRDQLPGGRGFRVADIQRVGGLSLSGEPLDHESSLVRWPGQAGLDGRLTDLVVMRRDSSTVSRPFELEVDRPTPSYVLTGSSGSLAIGRLRNVLSKHVERLRTTWLDAYLIELRQYEELQALAGSLREVDPRRAGQWRDHADRFRSYRTRDAWAALSDRPMEAAIARRARREFGTDALIARIQTELDDHNIAAQTRSAEWLNVVLLLLTVATIVVPLLLAGFPDDDTLAVLGWILGMGTAFGVGIWFVSDRYRRR